jgi:hypothetical protein
MPKYIPMRTPEEFRKWLEQRRNSIGKQIGRPPEKIKYTKVMRILSCTPGIYISDSVLNQFFKRRKL